MKEMGKIRTTNTHEYTRMHTNEYELSNHEKHENTKNKGII